MNSKNVFGEPLITCSNKPLTGYFRDGCCNTDENDRGIHTVCIVATKEFLKFSKATGNDLSTPYPEYSFKGVKPGDRWCLCAERFKEALEHGKAPNVVLEATHERTLDIVGMDQLIEHAHYTVEN